MKNTTISLYEYFGEGKVYQSIHGHARRFEEKYNFVMMPLVKCGKGYGVEGCDIVFLEKFIYPLYRKSSIVTRGMILGAIGEYSVHVWGKKADDLLIAGEEFRNSLKQTKKRSPFIKIALLIILLGCIIGSFIFYNTAY